MPKTPDNRIIPQEAVEFNSSAFGERVQFEPIVETPIEAIFEPDYTIRKEAKPDYVEEIIEKPTKPVVVFPGGLKIAEKNLPF